MWRTVVSESVQTETNRYFRGKGSRKACGSIQADSKYVTCPGQDGLASQRNFFLLAFDLRFVWPPTCVDFGRAQIRIQVDASFSPFGRSTQVDTR